MAVVSGGVASAVAIINAVGTLPATFWIAMAPVIALLPTSITGAAQITRKLFLKKPKNKITKAIRKVADYASWDGKSEDTIV